MTGIAICCRGETANAGLALATDLRRMGEPVDLHYTGKLDRQFERAKRSDATIIATIRSDSDARLWWKWRSGVNCTLDDVRSYLLWMADETDTYPDPPEYMLVLIRQPLPDKP